MRKRNWPLIIGGIIIGIIAVVMLFPGLFTHINPYGGKYFQSATLLNGRYTIMGAPFPPSHEYILGSDELGRDIYSLIIYGTRLTITMGILVVLGRFLVAIPMGIAAGFGNKACKTIINQFSIAFSAIPALIISVIILRMRFFTSLFKRESIIAFVIVLTFIGWAKLAQMITERVEFILGKPFVKGETALGKSKFKIILENLLPHLSAELVVLFFMELATALAILMQLGIFLVFVGNLKIIKDSSGGVIQIANISFEPEWASMLGTANANMVSAPWTLIPPVVAFFISIFGFNLFGEGLRNILQKRDSMFIPKIRRAFSFERQDFKLSNLNPIKGRFRFVSIVIILTVIYFGVNAVYNTRYNFSSVSTTASLNIRNHEEVIIGTNDAKEAAEDISLKLKQYGYIPIEGNNLVIPYSIQNKYYCYDSSMKININNKDCNLTPGKDYAPYGFGDYTVSGELYDSTDIDLFSLKNYSVFDNKVVMINGNIYSSDALKYFSDEIMKRSKAKGIILINKSDDGLQGFIGENRLQYPAMWITNDMEKKINGEKSIVSFSMKSKKLDSTGRNIIGYLPGSDDKLSKDAIFIGFSYNYSKKDKDMGNKKLSFELEMAKRLSKIKRDRAVIIAFWDGTLSDSSNGLSYYCKNPIYEPEHVSVYLDLTKLNTDKSGNVYYNSTLSPISRYFAWGFAHNLEVGLDKEASVVNYDNVREVGDILASTPNVDETMYINGRAPTVIVAMKEDGSTGNVTLDKLGEIILKTIQISK